MILKVQIGTFVMLGFVRKAEICICTQAAIFHRVRNTHGGEWGGGGSSVCVWSLSYRASICHPAIRPSYPSLADGVVQPGICKNTQRKWSLWARQE